MKRLLLTIPFLFLLTGCTVSTDTFAKIEDKLEDAGQYTASDLLKEYVANNAVYTAETEKSQFYTLEIGDKPTDLETRTDGETLLFGSPTLGYIEFEPNFLTTGYIIYTDGIKTNDEGEEVKTYISAELSAYNDTLDNSTNVISTYISENYKKTEVEDVDDSTRIIRSIPNEHFENYWYVVLKSINGKIYITSITTTGYDPESSEQIFQDLISTRTYP